MKYRIRNIFRLLAIACSMVCILAGCSGAPADNATSSTTNAQPPSVASSTESDGSGASDEEGAMQGDTADADGTAEPTADTSAPSAATTTKLGPSPAWVANLPEAAESDQIFVVAVYGPTTAWASMHEKDASGTWQMVVTTPGFIGQRGLGKTREGDALTPQGSFTFDRAFGIAPDPGCKMTYTQVTDDLYWSGDHREGMRYNQMVDIKDVPGLDTTYSEHLIDYTREYQYCLNISYNPDHIPGNGSAIFLHCLGAAHPYTGGCVAIPEDQMIVVMQHVEPGCAVVIDTLGNLGATM